MRTQVRYTLAYRDYARLDEPPGEAEAERHSRCGLARQLCAWRITAYAPRAELGESRRIDRISGSAHHHRHQTRTPAGAATMRSNPARAYTPLS